MITNKDEDYCLTRKNDKKDVLDNMENNLHFYEEYSFDSNDDENIFAKGKQLLSRLKKNHFIDNIIGNLDEGYTTQST